MGDVAISGGTEEMEREEGTGEKAGEDQGGRVVRWERFLPRMCLRVLLVEADDSTRQIIAALLRKCSYRVAAAADGLKAWETLKEKSQSIDLVLAEVELPSLSGYSLLTMIMEHDSCKNIPVIMMSSHDSINMVFKCMLKGAADFLVKPIRKNELRNLWQHVWRRNSSNGGLGGTCRHQVENHAQLKSEANSENNAASNHSSDFIDSFQKKRDCSKKGSDTQSSCTRPDMEAESAYVQNIQDQRQSSCINSSVTTRMGDHKDDACCKMDEELSEAKNTLVLDVANSSQVINSSDSIPGKEDPSAGVTAQRTVISTGCMDDDNILSENNELKFGQSNCSREVDLIGVIDHQSQCKHWSRGCSAVQTDVSYGEIIDDPNDQKFRPSLELSLQRFQHIATENQEKDELNLLNHSHSSAFSRYNSRAVLSHLPMSDSLRGTELQVCPHNVIRPSKVRGPIWSSTSQHDGTALNINLEDSDSPGFHLHNQGAAPCSNPGLLPYPLPIAGIAYDGPCSPHGSVMRPVFYTQSTLPVWSLNPAKQEAPHARLSHQTEQEIVNSGQLNCPENQNSGNQPCEAEKEQVQNVEALEEKHVSSITGQSKSSYIHNGSRSHPSSSGCGSVCNGSNGNPTAICNGSSMDVSGSNMESTNGHGHFTHDGMMVDIQRSIQREAALNKFRLKRKDRCYEKKVRSFKT
ncbi:hypothetical protein Taro_035266 [Colocasia esculenta]|uniref:Response regulatory domain-containing protein n=1 Tax=Colocasia esculenta TaxID=4460 RepID=A0A843W3A3_COLES|nr:hypothetical protein [Colocasia esculenta]